LARFEKPFNPILGETWQATLSDGTAVFMEQVSHHPPVAAFQLVGPGDVYTLSGISQPAVQYKANGIKTLAKGHRSITFADGGRIEIQYPHYSIKGLLYTRAPRGEVGGTVEFVDRKNRLQVKLAFGRCDDTGSKLLARPDAFSGKMFRVAEGHAAQLNGRTTSSPDISRV
jgi:hypothetical protein